jgi:MoxR-like ATPase
VKDGMIGREKLVENVTDLVIGGAEVLLHGPMGIGKTTILEAVATRVRSTGRPCGFAPRTKGLGDVTGALAAAFPEANAPTQRRLRNMLLRHVEKRPAVLVLDHVLNAPTAMRSFLRSLRGNRTGVVFAFDVEHPRDHRKRSHPETPFSAILEIEAARCPSWSWSWSWS